MLLDPSWLLREDLLDRHTRLQQIPEVFATGVLFMAVSQGSWDFKADAIRPDSSFKLSTFFLRDSFSSLRDLALEFDFRIIISCQYFTPKAELSKAQYQNMRSMSMGMQIVSLAAFTP